MVHTVTKQEQLNRYLGYLNNDKHNLKLLLDISNLCCDLDDLVTAQYYLNHIKHISNEAGYGVQGRIALQQEQLAQARDCFIQALHYEENPWYRYYLAFIYYADNDMDNALRELDHIAPYTLAEADLLTARILHRHHKLEDAITLVRYLVNNSLLAAQALGFLSLLYLDAHDESHALLLSKQALALNPHNYDAQLVNMLLRIADKTATSTEIMHLLTINPKDSRLWFALGTTYLVTGQYSKAKDALMQAIILYPNFYDCYIALAWCHIMTNDLDTAYATYYKATQLAPKLADGWGGLALACSIQNDIPQAQQHIVTAKQLNATCYLMRLAVIFCTAQSNPQEAQKQLNLVLEDTTYLDPTALSHFIKGYYMHVAKSKDTLYSP